MFGLKKNGPKEKDYLFKKAKFHFDRLPEDKQAELIDLGNTAFDNLDPFTQAKVANDIKGLGLPIGKCMAITAIARSL